MHSPDSGHVLDYYAHRFRPDMVDLSSSSPSAPGSEPSEYPAPGGSLALRQLIAGLYPGLGPENVVVTNGASEALAASAFAFAGAGTRVHLARGTYPSFGDLARRMGADISCGDQIPDDAGVIVINNPSVPDGRLRDIEAHANRCARRGRRLICDEVYLDLRPETGATPAASCSDSAVSIGDLSKPLGLGGLRIGWAASQDLAAIDKLTRHVQMLTGGPSNVAMQLAVEALEEYGARLTANAAHAARNGEQVFAALAAAGWTFRKPEMGWTFVAHPPHSMPESVFQRLERLGIFLVPASAFGLEGGLRLSVFAPVGALRRALAIAASGRQSEQLVILAKAPAVSKTRLASQVGAGTAARVARAMLEDTLSLAKGSGREVLIAFTPECMREEFIEPAIGAAFVPQPDGDLGERIRAALGAAIGEGRAAVLIGTDTPHLPEDILDEAFAALWSHDVVLGPATDGGFYLLGLAPGAFPDGLFDGVEWSTDSVFTRVSANASRRGLRLAVLTPHTDVDDLGSLRTVVEAGSADFLASRTKAAVNELRVTR